MSQNDFTLANQSFPAFRADLNSALQALATNNSGGSAPSTTFANMWWYDTSNNILYIRNEDNDAWIQFATLDQANDLFVVTSSIDVGDNVKAKFGDGDDLQIYHDATDSIILDNGTGNLRILCENFRLQDPTEAETYITADRDGAVGLRFNDSQKLATTNTGIDVTGTVVSDGMSTNTAGTSNFIAGVNAGNSIASGGNYNTVVGDEAGTAITIGSNNTLIGTFSGDAISTSSSNTAVGSYSMTNMTDGNNNVAVGTSALDLDTKGNYSVAVGRNALGSQNFTSLTNTHNTALGYNAGLNVTTGIQNTILGSLAGDALTDADYNVAIGYQALTSDRKGGRTVAIGYNALQNQDFASTTDTFNTAVGMASGQNNVTGIQNTYVGYGAGNSGLDSYNVAVGYNALANESAGERNTAIGRNALGSASTTGESTNTAIGFNSGELITTGIKNTILGSFTGNQGGLDIRASNNNIVLSDGNGNPRVYIDGAGTFLTGEISTSAVLNGSGAYIQGTTGSFYGSATGTQHYFNRVENGNILTIRQGGVDRGNIGTNSAKLYISSTGNAGLKFRDDLNCIMPCNADGTNSDADQDLGQAGVRFKNLYLSGGIRLGGTGTANELDDYEEGTCTFTYTGSGGNPTVTYDSVSYGFYTKIGRKVFIEGRIRTDAFSGGSGSLQVSGLPFTVSNIDPNKYTSGGGIVSNDFGSNQPHSTMAIAGTTSFYCIYGNYNINNVSDCQDGLNKNQIQFSFFYMAI